MTRKLLLKLQTYLQFIEAILSFNSFKIRMHDHVMVSNAVRDSMSSKKYFHRLGYW